jgi:hypothetical protein
VVDYLRDGRVSGVVLWNVWDQVDAARKLIAERGLFRPRLSKDDCRLELNSDLSHRDASLGFATASGFKALSRMSASR